MRRTFYSIFLFQFIIIQALCASPKNPKTLDEAISVLMETCPKEVQKLILETKDDNLLELHDDIKKTYEFRTIHMWSSQYNKKSKLKKHFSSLGVTYYKHHRAILLIAFKRKLQNKAFDLEEEIKPFAIIEERWAYEDKHRYEVDTIRGVYIPIDLEDCLNQLDAFWNDTLKAEIKNKSEDDFISSSHFGIGIWMRNNWGLWSGSRLSSYFQDLGLNHPDDMSGLILSSYHRKLNNKDYDIEKEIERYQKWWEDVNSGKIQMQKIKR